MEIPDFMYKVARLTMPHHTWAYMGWERPEVPLDVLLHGIKHEVAHSRTLRSELYRRADEGLLPEVVPPEVAELLMQRAAGVS